MKSGAHDCGNCIFWGGDKLCVRALCTAPHGPKAGKYTTRGTTCAAFAFAGGAVVAGVDGAHVMISNTIGRLIVVRRHVIAAMGCISVGLFFAWTRMPPVEFEGDRILTPTVQQGGSIEVARDAMWLRSDCRPAEISAELIDSQGYHHVMANDSKSRLKMGASLERQWPVPFTVPWGRTTYQSHWTFACFPYYGAWPVKVDPVPLSFNVVPTINSANSSSPDAANNPSATANGSIP